MSCSVVSSWRSGDSSRCECDGAGRWEAVKSIFDASILVIEDHAEGKGSDMLPADPELEISTPGASYLHWAG